MISNKIFTNADGSVTRFLSDFIVRSQDFARPYAYIYDNTLDPGGTQDQLQDGSTDQADWVWPDNIWKRGSDLAQSNDIVTVDKWQIVDNSILFFIAPLVNTTIWLEVATTSEEFGDTLTQASVLAAEQAASDAAGSADDAAASAASIEASSVQIETNRTDIIANDTAIGVLDSTKAATTYVDTADGLRALKSGDVFTGQVKGITPIANEDLTRKDYVDAKTVNILSGTNIPTATIISNIDTVTENKETYIRVGSIVSVAGLVTVDMTASGTATFELTLPISSIFSDIADLSGNLIALDATDASRGVAIGGTANNKARIIIYSTQTAAIDFRYTYQYEII